MGENEEEYIGYLKYSGKSVENGLLDIRKSAEALSGFDEILRFFLEREDLSLVGVQFEIPVRIKKGSWEVLVPILEKLVSPEGACGAVVTAYGLSVANKAGSDGFLESGPAKDIQKSLKAALTAAQWVIKIASHIATFTKKKFEEAKIHRDDKNKVFIDIPNEQGEMLRVEKKYFDLFLKCPEKLFSKNAGLVENDRILALGVYEGKERREVSITEKQKMIFYREEEPEGILFPELKHGEPVELEGGITRGNEKTNTLGFEYCGHILTCKPARGSITTYKDNIISNDNDRIFLPVRIKGTVSRKDKHGELKEKKPMIVFTDITPIENDDLRRKQPLI